MFKNCLKKLDAFEKSDLKKYLSMSRLFLRSRMLVTRPTFHFDMSALNFTAPRNAVQCKKVVKVVLGQKF